MMLFDEYMQFLTDKLRKNLCFELVQTTTMSELTLSFNQLNIQNQPLKDFQ
jgi:hypothetical protein